jgi:hypothetical protein
MHASGDDAAALKVAAASNLARIGDMHFAELDAWASASGFTKDELARIQPAYVPEPLQLDSYLQIMVLLCVVGAFACVSIVANAARLVRAYGAHLGRSILGIVAGIALIGIALIAHIDGDYNRPWIRDNLTRYQLIAIGVGMASVFFAVIPFFLRRNAPTPTDPPEPNGLSQPQLKSTGIKEMDGWN